MVLVGRVNLTLEGKHVKWVFYDRGGSGGDGEEMVLSAMLVLLLVL